MSAVGQWAGTYSSAVQGAAAKPTAGTATCATRMTKPVRLRAQTVQYYITTIMERPEQEGLKQQQQQQR